MKKLNKNNWLGIALANLSIVALLGLILRSKILFSIPFVDFKDLLHAHSHFAFGGWVTLALITLMIYEVLPKKFNTQKKYQWLLFGIVTNAIGMLVSFLFEGYAFFSILFSTLFIFVSYAFGIIFVKHLYQSGASKTVKLLSTGALIYLVLSSVGPFTLAYLLAHKSGNAVLYRDAIYTYLHLQYNGFFTLSVFALLINRIENTLSVKAAGRLHRFAQLLHFSVLPSMFLCYLWHYPNIYIRIIAMVGSASMVLCTIYFLVALPSLAIYARKTQPLVRNICSLALAAFVLKMIFQSMTLVHVIGQLVFPNRPVIIGFLHMVLLGFVSLYLLAHLINARYLPTGKATGFAAYLFATAVTLNTVVLMGQGLGMMLGYSSSIFPKLLWLMAILMFGGTIMLLLARRLRKKQMAHNTGDIKPIITHLLIK